jgi:hypothetical protein
MAPIDSPKTTPDSNLSLCQSFGRNRSRSQNRNLHHVPKDNEGHVNRDLSILAALMERWRGNLVGICIDVYVIVQCF